MVYYKIPLTGGLDYPAGCVLICAYTYGGYEYCKFERLTSVGSDWVKITESEFNVRCPEFPAPVPSVMLESTEYPGCYYRIVDGETEWINPPMIMETEYRTAKRYSGKPVYTKVFKFPNLRVTSFPLGIEGDIFSFCGNAVWPHGAIDPFPMFSESGSILAIAFIDSGNIKISVVKDIDRVIDCSAIFTVEYTK